MGKRKTHENPMIVVYLHGDGGNIELQIEDAFNFLVEGGHTQFFFLLDTSDEEDLADRRMLMELVARSKQEGFHILSRPEVAPPWIKSVNQSLHHWLRENPQAGRCRGRSSLESPLEAGGFHPTLTKSAMRFLIAALN